MRRRVRQIWYESETLSSTERLSDMLGRGPGDVYTGARAGAAAELVKRSLATIADVWRAMLFATLALGCATGAAGATGGASSAPPSGSGSAAGDGRAPVGVVPGPAPEVASQTSLTLAGARCGGGTCKCRQPGVDDIETELPPAGAKRFEIRLSALAGRASVSLSQLGTLAAAPDDGGPPDVTQPVRETCAYIDIPIGTVHDVEVVSRETVSGEGVAPRMRMAEYGPKGGFWYDVVAVGCEGSSGRCDRGAAQAWAASARQRKRGRLDPCGSAVVTRLRWATSGGQAERDGGLFRDFSVELTMEVKKFATSFAPGSPECVPK